MKSTHTTSITGRILCRVSGLVLLTPFYPFPIFRKENIKKQSQKKWDKRDKEVKEKMAAKQQKRTANIRAKKDEKIKKKVKKMTKKGRLVPGLNAPDV